MANWGLIDHWVASDTEQGQALLDNPDPRFPVFHPSDHPDFEPQQWNQAVVKANCMAYALNARDEKLNPGHIRPLYMAGNSALMDEFTRVAHRMFVDIPQDEFAQIVRMGVELDGLTRVNTVQELYKPDHYLAGLYMVDKNAVGTNDFHFIRLDSNGYWSMAYYGHKGISFHDENDERIVNPAKAKLNTGLNFDGFYHVPKGGIETLRPRIQARP